MELETYGYIRFSERKWLERFVYGEISFSCPGKFIIDAICTADQTRGDYMEAVFARLKSQDRRIEECKQTLGNDLEIIYDKDDYVFLRRRSSCLVPIFCFFAVTADNFKKEENEGKIKLSFEFPMEMYKGFCDNDQYCSAFVQAKPFDGALKSTFKSLGITYKEQAVDYTEKGKNEFFIEPDKSRQELFYKHPKYVNQHEVRIILPYEKMNSAFQRKEFQLRIMPEDIYIFPSRVKMVVEVNV